jgi:signal transduction histidine kinase
VSTEADSSAPALARAQALLQAALETSADALLVTDDAGRAETGNLRFLALFGLSPAELAALAPAALIHRLASRCREPEAAATRIESVQASAEEADDVVELADGRHFARFSLPVSLAGRRLGRIWRYREIAAVADAAAPAPAAEATRALRLKDEFIANLSHALRTPLGAVLGWSKALQLKRGDAATLARGLDAIARNAARQAQLLDEMIDAERVLSDRILLDPRPLDMAALVSAAVDAAQPAVDAKGLRLFPLLEPLGRPVRGDPDRLRQVVASLLANAIRFTPQGGRIEVLMRPVGGQLELTIRDDGEGIAPARLPRLFERHDPGDPASVRSRDGLGLAMPVARKLIELHSGSIEAASAGPDAGSSFTVRLPLASG